MSEFRKKNVLWENENKTLEKPKVKSSNARSYNSSVHHKTKKKKKKDYYDYGRNKHGSQNQ